MTEYKNNNEAPFQLPTNYIEVFKDGWHQWNWRLMSNDWELVKGKIKYKTKVEVLAAVESMRGLFMDRHFCPTLDVQELIGDNE